MDHLGMVAVKIKELGIIEFLDEKIPKNSQHNVSVVQAVSAMITMGLGYVNQTLHITPQFFSGLCIEKLIGPGLQAQDFNDDVLGRALDSVYEKGATELFLELFISILPMISKGEDMRFHADTTSLSLYGKYNSEEKLEEEKEEKLEEDGNDKGYKIIQINKGHSKDNHPELNQYLIGLVTNQHGIPCYFESMSGNRSDKESIINLKESGISIKEAS